MDDTGLGRSLKSAADENPLPCARSLLAQGFNPADVSTWGETGGIPETAVPFILEHYGINATSPSNQARAVLLALTRVGVNRLPEGQAWECPKCGTLGPTLSESQQSLDWLMSWSQRWVVEFDDRRFASDQGPRHVTGAAACRWGAAGLQRHSRESRHLRMVARCWKIPSIQRADYFAATCQFGKEEHDQYVDGAKRKVAHYDKDWLMPQLERLYREDPSLFERQK